MLSSITPLGERGRGRSFRTTATAYLAGSVVGGSLLGTAFGGLGGLLPGRLQLGEAPAWFVLATAAFAGLLLDVRFAGSSLPTVRRQVNENWLGELRGVVLGVGYGFQLGLGVVTIVTSSLIYLTWIVAVLSGSALTGLAIGAAFGLARAVPLLAMRRVKRPDQLAAAHRRLAAWAAPAHRAALLFAGTIAAAALLTGVVQGAA